MSGMERSGDAGTMKEPHCPHEEDRLSVREGDGRMPSEGAVRETLGTLKKTFRASLRRAGEKNPLSPHSKGSKVKPPGGDSTHPQEPPSPGPSPLSSPLKSLGSFLKKKEENGVEGSPRSESTTTAFGDSLMKTSASFRRRFGSKKEKERTSKQESLLLHHTVVEEKKEEEEEKTEWEEVEESYTLPEIPATPLSVMQINSLIDMEVLEEAHLHLLSLREEFQRERGQCGEEASSVELAKKEKDLSLLYGNLRAKVKDIVRDSNSPPPGNKEHLLLVARIIQEEERREGDPGGVAGWREFWREAVGAGVQGKLGSIQLDGKEQDPSWLAVHLGLLGKALREELENVKKELQWFYPPSFNVFSTYVRSYHRAVGLHLKKLQQQVEELKDLYVLLDWIINCYQSERIMGSPSLRPEMESEDSAPYLEDGFLEQLKAKYCSRVQENMRSSLDKILEIENEFWKDRNAPEREDGVLNSQIHMDIWTIVQSNVVHSRNIDVHLEGKVLGSCLQELKQFPKRFESEIRRCCSAADVSPSLWAEYQISYINSFTDLKQHMENYRDSCSVQVEQFSKEVTWLLVRLGQGLEDQYKDDVKPYLRRMMTRKWLTNDDDFKQLRSRTERLLQHCAVMKVPYVQTFASRLHYHTASEYVSQLMKNNYSCKNRKHEAAARKIREQWAELRELFEGMKSTHEWLRPLGDQLSDIIGQKNKRDIKNHLRPLVEHYPDIRKKNMAALLDFRGLRGRERQLILQRLTELKRNRGNAVDKSRLLFTDMEVTANTDCLAELPLSCLAFLAWRDLWGRS